MKQFLNFSPGNSAGGPGSNPKSSPSLRRTQSSMQLLGVTQVCLPKKIVFFVKSTVCLLFIYSSGLAASKEAVTAAVATTSTTKPVTDLGEIEVASSASATVLNSNSNGMY